MTVTLHNKTSRGSAPSSISQNVCGRTRRGRRCRRDPGVVVPVQTPPATGGKSVSQRLFRACWRLVFLYFSHSAPLSAPKLHPLLSSLTLFPLLSPSPFFPSLDYHSPGVLSDLGLAQSAGSKCYLLFLTPLPFLPSSHLVLLLFSFSPLPRGVLDDRTTVYW